MNSYKRMFLCFTMIRTCTIDLTINAIISLISKGEGMETVHLIDLASRNHLIKHLLKTQPVLFNHRFQSFDQTFYQETSTVTRLFETHQYILKHLDQFVLLKETLHYDNSIQQALSFLDLMDRYQLNLDRLPTSTALEQEKTILIKLISEVAVRPYLRTNLASTQLVVHPFYQELYHKYLLKDLISVPLQQQQPTIRAIRSLNVRQEVSVMIDQINEEQPESLLILCGNDKYINELKRQESKLSFPLSYLNKSEVNIVLASFYYFIDSLATSNMESFVNFLDINIFNLEHTASLIDVIYRYDLDFNRFKTDFIHLDAIDLSMFQNRFDQAQEINTVKKTVVTLQKMIQSINCLTVSTLVSETFSLFSSLLKKKQALQLKQALEDLLPHLTDDNYLNILKSSLLSNQKQTIVFSNYLVADSTFQPSYAFETCVFLGMTQNNYPNFNSMSGLYGESYVEKIEGFPSLMDRIEFHQQQMLSFITCSKKLYIFSPQIDYQGKAYETPFEIDDYLNKNGISYETIYLEEPLGIDNPINNLDSSVARQLFFKDNKLLGSISSFEIFFKNSYQYFIEQGLRVREKNYIDLDVQTVGTISHDVLENLVRRYEKDYPHHPQDICDFLKPYYHSLKQLYPSRIDFLKFSFERLNNSLSQTLIRLNRLEQSSSFQPHKDFLEFKYSDFKLFDDLEVYLVGFIDRMDTDNTNYVIYDYKSSFKKLEDKKLLEGQQLQLITYALVYNKLSNKTCTGVYYINLKEAYESHSPYHYTPTNGLSKTDFPVDKPLSGYTFNLESGNPLTEMIQSLKLDKAKTIKNLHNLEFYSNQFYYLYRLLLELLNEGLITRVNVDNSYFYFKDHERLSSWFPVIETISEEINRRYRIEENNYEV